MKNIARDILNDDRGDLVGVWFNAHRDQIGRLKELAQVAAFSGAANDLRPGSIYDEIGLLSRQATYNFVLVEDAYNQRKHHWGSKEWFKRTIPTIERALEKMIEDVNEIAKLHTSIGGLITKTDSFSSDPEGFSSLFRKAVNLSVRKS